MQQPAVEHLRQHVREQLHAPDRARLALCRDAAERGAEQVDVFDVTADQDVAAANLLREQRRRAWLGEDRIVGNRGSSFSAGRR